MKKLILLLMIVAVVFVAFNRQRLFLRDPLATVNRSGVVEHGAQVFINYSNDVLLENDNAPMYVLLIQHGQRIGMPPMLRCLHFALCMTDAIVATLASVTEGAQVESMTAKRVAYRDAKGVETVVTLY